MQLASLASNPNLVTDASLEPSRPAGRFDDVGLVCRKSKSEALSNESSLCPESVNSGVQQQAGRYLWSPPILIPKPNKVIPAFLLKNHIPDAHHPKMVAEGSVYALLTLSYRFFARPTVIPLGACAWAGTAGPSEAAEASSEGETLVRRLFARFPRRPLIRIWLFRIGLCL